MFYLASLIVATVISLQMLSVQSYSLLNLPSQVLQVLKDVTDLDRVLGINNYDTLSRDSSALCKMRSTVNGFGYPIEEYNTTTEDGYILKLFRIPSSPYTPQPQGAKTPVFLQHGLLCSSVDWVSLGRQQSLAFMLADAGYDVWLGNARGNTFSRRHTSLSTRSKEFWDFSWHEIGKYDYARMIDFVLGITKQPKLHWIGHSQGTTGIFVLGSERIEYMNKLISFQALSPVVFWKNIISPIFRIIGLIPNQVDLLLQLLGMYEFFPSSGLTKTVLSACQINAIIPEICSNIIFLIGGYNSVQLDRNQVPVIFNNTPAGAAVNQLVHFSQLIYPGGFRQFNHGLFGNLRKYRSFTPPDYKLQNVIVPTVLWYGENDWLAAVEDVYQLAHLLPNLVGFNKVPDSKFTHFDFLYAKNIKKLLYDNVLQTLNSFK